MKRSDMVKFMEQCYAETTRGGMSEMNIKEQMDFILSKMEESGMLPPEWIRVVDFPNGQGRAFEEISWEPENED